MNTRTVVSPISITAAALVFAVTAGGCAALGSNYERPKLEPPAQFRGVTTPQAAESAADIPWWKVFEDPALQRLVRDGITSNLDLRVASARVMESRALAGIAKSYLYPEIGVGFGTRQEQVSRVGDPKARSRGARSHLQQLGPEWHVVVGDRPVRPAPPRQGSGLRPVPRD